MDSDPAGGRPKDPAGRDPDHAGERRPNGPAGSPPSPPSERRPNHLAGQTSPYLAQHAYNPVNWYPWSEEALEKARREDRPIFLSIGYSACHWCHVMERESFENEEIARFLNDHFVSIKVDREERPDLDDLYMSAVQIMTGQGGWPMSVWLTPELKPFYGGTYFPPNDHHGRPGFLRILQALAEAYRTRRGEIESSATGIADRIVSFAELPRETALLTAGPLEAAAASLARSFDSARGGFGPAPKFPPSMALRLLLRRYQRTQDIASLRCVQVTLDRMAAGGIYDHLGGGFHRYSTDDRWLVPHFEKMLYDQALLVPAYLEAWLVTRDPACAAAARGTLDYVLRDMRSAEGGFFSAEDADSEGEEGRFYTWTPEEVRAALGEARGALFCRAYDVDEVGNFDGRSILHPVMAPRDLVSLAHAGEEEVANELARCREILRLERERRSRPLRDEKIICAWNGLMIAALAQGGRVLGDLRFTKAAEEAADFIQHSMMRDGRLLRVYKDGSAHGEAYLEDYAGLLHGLVELYESSFDSSRLESAAGLASVMEREFGDRDQGGFYNTSVRHAGLIARLRNAQDGSTPSGNSLAAHALLRLGRMVQRPDVESAGEGTLRAFHPLVAQFPGAFHYMLLALDLYLGPRQEIVLVGPRDERPMPEFLALIRGSFLPRAVTLLSDPADAAQTEPAGASGAGRPGAFEGKIALGGRPTAYLCQDFVCQAPVTEADDLELGLRAI